MTPESAIPTGRVIRFQLGKPTPSGNRVLRTNRFAAANRKKALAWEIKAQLAGQIPAVPFQRARITVERHSIGELDEDNSWSGLKWLLDVLQPPKSLGKAIRHKFGLSLIADDGPAYLTTKICPVRVGRRTEQKTTVIIEELT